jgi:AcrR family transcriptional regulator
MTARPRTEGAARGAERQAREWGTTPATRRRILAAALECFDQKGVAATTIDDIRAASGMTVGSIYHHFAGKDDVFEQLVHGAMTDYLADLIDALEGGAGVEESVRRLVRFHVTWVEERSALTKLMLSWEESERGRPGGREHYRQYSEAIGAWLHREARAGRIRRMEPDLYSALLMGPLMEYARQRSGGITTTSPRTIERGLVDGLLRVLVTEAV